jgi:hypothetical protein
LHGLRFSVSPLDAMLTKKWGCRLVSNGRNCLPVPVTTVARLAPSPPVKAVPERSHDYLSPKPVSPLDAALTKSGGTRCRPGGTACPFPCRRLDRLVLSSQGRFVPERDHDYGYPRRRQASHRHLHSRSRHVHRVLSRHVRPVSGLRRQPRRRVPNRCRHPASLDSSGFHAARTHHPRLQRPERGSDREPLRAKGVIFNRYPAFPQDEVGILTVPGGSVQVAWFKDPDGNVLSVTNA